MTQVVERNRRRLASWGFGVLAAIALAATACSSVTHHYGFSGSISSITPTSTSQASVTVDIKNTGRVAGTPSCSVELYSPNHTYTGFQTLNSHQRLEPGETISRTTNVTVHRDGAHQVTVSDSRVHCYQSA